MNSNLHHRRGVMLDVESGSFVDPNSGSTFLFRGVNLGGSSKVPSKPDGHTHVLVNEEEFYNPSKIGISFVGRPFPLEEADEHFGRLKSWGFNLLRFIVTWEAIEHKGPGEYDEEYLEYVRQVLIKAGEYDFFVIIDPHQDCWSRFSGGDGAPLWTFELLGIDVTAFHDTGAATIHNITRDQPRMVWPTNYDKFATATMFTLFFASEIFAPKCLIRGISAQQYLQSHFFRSMQRLAQRVTDLPHVIGFDSINEPSRGYIGVKDVREFVRTDFQFKECPSAIQGILAASGYAQEVVVYEKGMLGFYQSKKREMNPMRRSVWKKGYSCIWKNEGIWDCDNNNENIQVLRPSHFSVTKSGQAVDFNQDCLLPFLDNFHDAIKEIIPDAIIFASTIPMEPLPTFNSNRQYALSPHFYDIVTLFTKSYNRWFTVDVQQGRHKVSLFKIIHLGPASVRKCIANQVAQIKRWGNEAFPNKNTKQQQRVAQIMCETGIPYDLNGAAAYVNGDYSGVEQALDGTIHAMEANALPYVLWNYTAENTHQFGDGWNGEDLSIFSKDDFVGDGGLYDGGRALPALVRPYPITVAGEVFRSTFDLKTKMYALNFHNIESCRVNKSVIFLPLLHYGEGCGVSLSDGKYELDIPGQQLIIHHDPAVHVHRLTVTPISSSSSSSKKKQQQQPSKILSRFVWFSTAATIAVVATIIIKQKTSQ